MNFASYFNEHKTWLACVGALMAGTGLCWFGRLSGGEWVATLALFVPLLTKEGIVQVKAMNIDAAAP